MLIEAFISLVNARGVDFNFVAGNASNVEGAARPRCLSRAEIKLRNELKLALAIEPTAQGKGSRVPRRPYYSNTDLAHAMHGVPRMPELALYYSLCGWLGAFEELHRGLMMKILQTMDETWPMTVTYAGGRIGEQHDYVHKLATLVLIADARKNDFIVAAALPAHLIGMDEPVWDRVLASRYAELQQQYTRWYLVAMGMVRKRIMNTAEDVEEVGELATA